MTPTRTCIGCGETLPATREHFHKQSTHRNGNVQLHSRCKLCHNLKPYGLTAIEYNAMLERQGGGCHLCGEACTTGRRLAVDHCHKTGEVRGLLCQACNTGIGKLKDSPGLLRVAAAYLEAAA